MNPQVNIRGNKLIVYFYRNNGRIYLSTGISIKPEWWSVKKKQLNAQRPEVLPVKKRLDKIVQKIEYLVHEHSHLSNQQLKHLIKKRLQSTGQSNDFYTHFETFIDEKEREYAASTARKYRVVKNRLLEMNPNLTYKLINVEWYHNFIDYFYSRGYATNTVGRKVRFLKSFLRWAQIRGYHSNTSYQSFKSFNAESDVIFLERWELDLLKQYNGPHTRTRDLFLLMCHTGLRHSDANNIRPSNRRGNVLVMQIIKTREKDLIVPLSKTALSILDNYENNIPRISNQKMNDQIKSIAKSVGLDQKVTVNVDRGPTVETKTVEKWRLVSTHCARRTFVTLSLEAGVSSEVVMSITGHKNHATMRKYLKVVDRLKHDAIARAWD